MDADEISRALRRMAVQITERNGGADAIGLVGIRRGGVPIAKRLQSLLQELEGRSVPVGSVDITLYRDDAATALPNPLIGRSDVTFGIESLTVILVDDVLFTGRTVRAAIDALFDYGRPRAVQLAALIDRGHRELPIAPDFVGRVIKTDARERVDVMLDCESGAVDQVLVTLPETR